MAFHAFLKIDSIPGEAADDKHADWIEVQSFSHGISQPSTVLGVSGGALSAEKPVLEDFVIVKHMDKASPKLYLACTNGEHIAEVTMEITRSDGDQEKYFEYLLTDVIISSTSPQGSTQSGDDRPVEEVSFNFAKIQWTYVPTDAAGPFSGDVVTYWDQAANKGG